LNYTRISLLTVFPVRRWDFSIRVSNCQSEITGFLGRKMLARREGAPLNQQVYKLTPPQVLKPKAAFRKLKSLPGVMTPPRY
jgi:hypothetical protein